MRIGFDATALTTRRSGIGRYTLELLSALLAHVGQHDYVLLSHRPLAADVRLPQGDRLRRLRGPGFPVRIAWMQTLLPVELAAARLDVCHFTNYHAPVLGPGRMVVTFHDMSLILSPEDHPARRVVTMRPLLRAVAHRADAVVTPTSSARDDALRLLDLRPERVHVVPEAPASAFRPVLDPEALEDVARRYGLTPGFLLSIGTLEPRKNHARLVDAFARLRSDGFGHPLVLVGGLGWKYEALMARIAEPDVAGAVRLLGHVPDDDLPPLLSLAGAFAYPSLYEGFGLPVVEAMASGTPTVTSSRGALAEVAGDACLLVEPTDAGAIAEAIGRILGDAGLRDRLRTAGLERAAGFSWARAAERTAAIYRAVAGA